MKSPFHPDFKMWLWTYHNSSMVFLVMLFGFGIMYCKPVDDEYEKEYNESFKGKIVRASSVKERLKSRLRIV